MIDFRACLSSSCINNSFQDKTKTRDEKSGPGLTQKSLFILGFVLSQNCHFPISTVYNASDTFIRIKRIKEMIANKRGFDCETNSPCQYQTTCLKISRENMDSDITVWSVNLPIFVCRHIA